MTEFIERIDPDGPAPVEQIIRSVHAAIHSGAIGPGHKVPTVRGLATTLGVAVNTVAKAYQRLEASGVLEGRGRAGTFVAVGNDDLSDSLDGYLDAAVAAAIAAGRTLAQTQRIMAAKWPESAPTE